MLLVEENLPLNLAVTECGETCKVLSQTEKNQCKRVIACLRKDEKIMPKLVGKSPTGNAT